MSSHIEMIHTEDSDLVMPYTPAVKSRGSLVHLAGVTAAPVYHSHPHVAAEFDGIPLDPADQTRLAVASLETILAAAGGSLSDIVEITRFIVDIDANQDAVNRILGEAFGAHRPASTTVEVTRLATDPRLVVELRAVACIAD